MKHKTLIVLLWASLAVVLLCVVVVSGQVPRNTPAYEEPVNRQGDEGLCADKMVKQLYLATDITDPAQEKYLLAAEAYRLLDEAGQRCP